LTNFSIMHKYVQQLMFLGSLLLACGQLQAQATLSVQGNIIQNFTGAAIDNGTYDITFRLYTTDTGGSPLWSETQSVNMIGGVYSVLLGAVNPLNLPFDQTYYLGLTLPGGPEHTPRTQLTAAPYALSLLGQDNKFPSTGMVKMEAVATGQATTTATSYNVTADDHVIFLDHTANQNVTLPAATAANAGRHLMLVNKAGVAKTLTSSSYLDITNATSTAVGANSVVELQSDGSVWRQTGGYAPLGQAKAYVFAKPTPDFVIPHSTAASTPTTVTWNEQTDTGNNFDGSTATFTAPRTGIYNVSGFLWHSSSLSGGYGYVRISGTCANCPRICNESNWTSIGNATYEWSNQMLLNAGETMIIRFVNQSNPSGPFITPGAGLLNSGYGWMVITEE
jgi:hypothetical protein